MNDPYLYQVTEVLKNLKGIQTEKNLKDIESDYTIAFFRIYSIGPVSPEAVIIIAIHFDSKKRLKKINSIIDEV